MPTNAQTDQHQTGFAVRPPISIVPQFDVRIDPAEMDRLDGLAGRFLSAEPALQDISAFGPGVTAGLTDTPRILIGDHSEIPLMDPAEQSLFGYRIGLLAGEGDVLVLAQARSPDFEHYLQRLLAAPTFDVLEVTEATSQVSGSLPYRCYATPHLLDRLVDVARNGQGACLVPHLTTGHVWRLGAAVAARSGAPISICGPSPRLSRRVNDKLWFAACVRDVLGQSALPPSFGAYGPAALAGEVKHLVSRFDRVVVKVPDSAGSAGNLSLESRRLRDHSVTELSRILTLLLHGLGWRDRYPLLVEVWETEVLMSPSIQVWVPHADEGLPVVEGIYQQVVEHKEGVFIGAVRAELPSEWEQRLSTEAMRLAYLFQRLGYFGRCSFDVLLSGTDLKTAAVHWIECNGRWGGVSVPMTFANRILADPSAWNPVIVQKESEALEPRAFARVLEQFHDMLFDPRHPDDGIVFLTPTGLEQGKAMHFMTLSGKPRALEVVGKARDNPVGSEAGVDRGLRSAIRQSRIAMILAVCLMPSFFSDERNEADVAQRVVPVVVLALAGHTDQFLKTAPMLDRDHQPTANCELLLQ